MSDLRARRRIRVFPDVPTALLLTIGSLLAGGFIGFLALDLGTLAATAIGTVVGIGGVATLAARRVAEPQAARIGLVGLDWRVLPVLFALVPAALLAKELDNVAYHWSPPPRRSPMPPPRTEPVRPERPARRAIDRSTNRPTRVPGRTLGPLPRRARTQQTPRTRRAMRRSSRPRARCRLRASQARRATSRCSSR